MNFFAPHQVHEGSCRGQAQARGRASPARQDGGQVGCDHAVGVLPRQIRHVLRDEAPAQPRVRTREGLSEDDRQL